MELEVRNVDKSFGSNHVLKDISFTVKAGRAFGLLGRNGSGKTTTIRIIMDIFEGDKGEVLINGKSNKKIDDLKIGYLPEERGLYPKRIISEQMIYFGELRGLTYREAKKRSLELLQKLEAEEYYKMKLETLSKGNQQKIQLAIAFINDPDILILDEPFSGLDPVNAKILKRLVSEAVKENKMVLFSSHQMSNVEEFCDDICIINKGEIALNGDLRDIKKSYQRNKILLVPENDDYDKLISFIDNSTFLDNIISKKRMRRNGYLIELKSSGDKNKVLKLFADSDQVELDSFAIVEPTLEEIFIEKAGDHEDE